MKKIVILGGGISGLATLHFLKQRFGESKEVSLLESSAQLGGKILTYQEQGFLFETGPNGFLDNAPATLELTQDLGLTNSLIQANPLAKRRYIKCDGFLHQVPTSFPAFLRFTLLNTSEKLRLLAGIIKRDVSREQSIDGYVGKRFGDAVARKMVDPLLRGISAGDTKRLHMKYGFPRLKKGDLLSFKGGMGVLITALGQRYGGSIQCNKTVKQVRDIDADLVISTVPAFAASSLTGYPVLNQITYSPVSVVGLGYRASDLGKHPDGYGYLIPSSQHPEVLGVLTESNVFEGRAPQEHIMFRVMLNTQGHTQEIIEKARLEIAQVYGERQAPVYTKVQAWPLAIPQYQMEYPGIINQVAFKQPNLIISGNFYGGIALNDCVLNAKNIAASIAS